MSDLKLLSADELLAVDDLEYDIVELPEIGAAIRVRGLTAAEQGRYEEALLENVGTKNQKIRLAQARALAVFYGAVDADGDRLFTKQGQVEALGQKSASMISRIASRIQELTRVSEEDYEEIKGN